MTENVYIRDALGHSETYKKFTGGRPIIATFVVSGDKYSISFGELTNSEDIKEGENISGNPLYLRTIHTGDINVFGGIETTIEKERESLGELGPYLNIGLRKGERERPILFRKAVVSLVYNDLSKSLEYKES